MPPRPDSRFAILLDGEFQLTQRTSAQIAGRRVLAADGGIRHAPALGVVPELWLGDFDSAVAEHHETFAHVPRQDFPAEKDVADGELAIREAIAMGARDLLLLGALGGPRSDHAFVNLAVAADLAQSGDIAFLLSSGIEEAVPVVPGHELNPDWPDGTIFSLACFSAVGGLTISNAKWPLYDVDVPFGSTFTLSNVVRGSLTMSLETGVGIAIAQLGGSGDELR